MNKSEVRSIIAALRNEHRNINSIIGKIEKDMNAHDAETAKGNYGLVYNDGYCTSAYFIVDYLSNALNELENAIDHFDGYPDSWYDCDYSEGENDPSKAEMDAWEKYQKIADKVSPLKTQIAKLMRELREALYECKSREASRENDKQRERTERMMNHE